MKMSGSQIDWEKETDAEANVNRVNKELQEVTGNPSLCGVGHHMEFVAPTNGGKTRAAKEMFHQYYRDLYDDVFVFSPNAMKDNWVALGIRPENLITRPSEEKFMAIIADAADKFEHSAKGQYNWFTLVILDDIADATRRWGNFVEAITTCRHDGTTIWCLVQDTKFLMPNVRAQMWGHSISDRYINNEALKRIADGKNIMVRRDRDTPEEDQVLLESMLEVRGKNRNDKFNWGRLFISNVGDRVSHSYQKGAELTPLENKTRRIKGGPRGFRTVKIVDDE